MHKDGWIATLDKALAPYVYEFEKKPRRLDHIWPQQVIGTINIDRRCCFSKSFLPLPRFEMGDFGYKWANVLRDFTKWLEYPIECYEFMHLYYVKEGNKRVSVSRYLHFPGIKANVTRIIPLNIDRADVRSYHEFLAFEKETGVSTLWFSSEKGFARLNGLLEKCDVNLHELVNTTIPLYVRMTGNSFGPFDALLDYLEIFPGKDAPQKIQETTLKQVLKKRKHLR